MSIGINKIVYAHEPCGCDYVDYSHLVERLYHAVCFSVDRCPQFRPWRDRDRSPACRDCGRPEDAHSQPECGEVPMSDSPPPR